MHEQSSQVAGRGITTDSLWKLMDRVEASITGVNSKATILFYLNGFLLTNLALQWPRLFQVLKGSSGSAGVAGSVAVAAIGLSAIGTTVSLWASYSAILPGNIARQKASGPKSLVFFAHVSQRTPEEYSQAIGACTEPELREDLIRQIHSLAVLVHTKQKLMRLAVQSAMSLSIPSLVILLALYLVRGV
jgi:hypothetical protein